MRTTPRTVALGLLPIVLLAGTAFGGDGPYAPPAGYYSGVNGTGPVLRAQLAAAMTNGHIQRDYGEMRFAAAITDADPDVPGNILLMYNRASVPATWDSGATWNREHVWPDSRQPGSASNSSRGNLGDHHALRPCNPSINSSRGNKPFGDATTTGPFGSIGSYYFPGDTDKGDAARTLFYSDVRWGASLGLTLVDTFPSGFQMGGLAALVAWHYMDPPDTFEIRRNHAIFSQAMNPQYYTNNRNALVDMPEAVWSLYVNQQNDTTLWVGDAPDADGASAATVALNAIVGTDPGQAAVTLNKSGNAGTYYRVTTTDGVTSNITGRHNAFAMGTAGNTRELLLGVASGATDTPGSWDEQVIINNLDLTLEGGQGNGGNDADDTVLVQINVYNPAVASFQSDAPVNELMLDLGVIDLGSGDAVAAFDLYNIAPLTTGAPMDLELQAGVGDTDTFSVGLGTVSSLPAGDAEMVVVSMSDEFQGDFEAVYTILAYNDRSLFAQPGDAQTLTLRLVGSVGTACTVDFAEPFGEINVFDLFEFLNQFQAQTPAADINGDEEWTVFDVFEFLNLYAAGCP